MIHILISNKDKSSISSVIKHFINLDKVFNFKSINVVDLGSKNFDSLFEYNFGKKIRFIYKKEHFFNKSKAINLGLNILKTHHSDYVLISDADIVFDKNTIEQFISLNSCILDEVIETKDKAVSRKAFGIIKTKIGLLIEVNGYDSNFIGWGFEDHDIIQRLSHVDNFVRIGQVSHISHNDMERIQNYEGNDRKAMRTSNEKYFRSKVDSPKLGTLCYDVNNLQTTTTTNDFNDVIIYE